MVEDEHEHNVTPRGGRTVTACGFAVAQPAANRKRGSEMPEFRASLRGPPARMQPALDALPRRRRISRRQPSAGRDEPASY